MKKLCFPLLIAAMFITGIRVSGQILGYPGATWVFHGHDPGPCYDIHEKWVYTGDTTVLGVTSKNLRVTRKLGVGFPPPAYSTSYFNRFFKVNGDTAWVFIENDSTWQEVYNFSLQIGDTTLNPLGNKMNGWAITCADSVPYNDIAIVTNTGITTIDGQSLRFYTLHYFTGCDTVHAYQTFYERVITLNYWHPDDLYWCGAVVECGSPDLVCYRDNGMMTDSTCADLTWFDHLSVPDEQILKFSIYPNPASNILVVQSNSTDIVLYDILSVDGKLVLSGLQSPINISHLPSGTYLITDTDRNGYTKFVKQ